jgi:hypothetical protein
MFRDAASVSFWAVSRKCDFAGDGFADTNDEGLLALTSLWGIGGHRNITRATNVVIPTLRGYVENTKVGALCGIGASPTRADHNLLS